MASDKGGAKFKVVSALAPHELLWMLFSFHIGLFMQKFVGKPQDPPLFLVSGTGKGVVP